MVEVDILQRFLDGWKEGIELFGACIVSVVNSSLLSIVYLLGLGPTAIVARILGKRFLDSGKKRGSYWGHLSLKKKKTEDHYRQF